MSKCINILCSLGLLSILVAGLFFNLKLSAGLYLTLVISAAFSSFLWPCLGLCLFLFALPIFGNKPGTAQECMLIISGMGLQLGLNCRLLSLKYESVSRPLSACIFYLLISFLSLFPVSSSIAYNWLRSSNPSPSMYLDFLNPESLAGLSLFGFNLISALFGHEDHLAYPFKSVFLTLLAISTSLSIYRLCKDKASRRFYFGCSILIGFLFSLFIGLIDFYRIIDLRVFREFDPVVNPETVALRLQSWFGHSGWYAEYLTMSAPFVMLFLAIGISFWKRSAIIILCLLLGEFVLILTFQRGGWLSYPLTLIAVWTAIYLVYMREKGHHSTLKAFKSSLLKIIISAPITLLFSLFALNFFGSNLGIDQYSSRFKDIAKASDRLDFVEAGIKIGLLNPIFGQGSESFALQYKREYQQPDGHYFGQLNLPLHGTAHGLYAQTFAGKGLIGLLSLIFIIVAAINYGFRFAISNQSSSTQDQVTSLACVCSLIAVAIYGFVQEVFYVQSLQYLFFVIIGMIYSLPSTTASSNQTNIKRYAKNRLYFLAITAILFLCHLQLSSGGARKYKDEFGCHQTESNTNQTWTWCSLRSEKFLRKSDLGLKTLEMAPLLSGTHSLRISACDQDLFNQQVQANQILKIDFSPAKILDCSDAPDGFIRIKSSTANYFVPALSDSSSLDSRVLSFRWIE